MIHSRLQYGPRTGGFILMWSVAIAVLLQFGTLPDAYQVYVVGLQPPFPYPWFGVLSVSFLMVAQGIILYVILQPESYSAHWRCSLRALALHVPVTIFFALFSMHAPPFFAWFLIWMLICSCALLLTVIASSLRAAIGINSELFRERRDLSRRFSIRHMLLGVAGVALILGVARTSLDRFHRGIAEVEEKLETVRGRDAP